MKLLTATALALLATPAIAETPVSRTSVVQLADLDLSSAHGRKLLDQRLSRAVIDVCGEASPADLAGQNDIRRCRTTTLARFSKERDVRIAAASSGSIEIAAR